MKRLLLLVMCLPIVCLGQGARFDSSVTTSATNVPYGSQAPLYTVPYSTITVCAYPNNGNPCTNTVSIYQDQALTVPQANPMMSDASGRFGFWVTAGQYSYSIVAPSGKFMGTYITTIAGGSGGGGAPGGNLYEIQSKQSSNQFGGTGYFSNSDHSTLLYPSRNNPILNYCGNRQCGDVKIYSQDAPTLNGSGTATGYGNAYFNYRKGLYTGLSGFNGYGNDTNDPPGGSTFEFQYDSVAFHSPGITQVKGSAVTCGKPGDCAGFYSYLFGHGGYRYGGDEGQTNIRANGGYQFQRQGGFQVSGSPGVGATTVNASILYGPDDVLVGGFIYDFSASPIASGNITAYDGANHLLTVTAGSVTPATNAGTTTTAINISSSEQNAVTGVSKTVTVNVTQGSGFTINNTDPLFFACGNPDIEIVVPTAVGTLSGGTQTITANFIHGHAAGCKVGQGGTVGVLDLPADRIGNNWKTSWFVFAAPDNSHIYEVSYVKGIRGNINSWRHNFGGGLNTVTNANITGDGTTIKACNLGQLSGNFAGQYVQISGATPSSFNGVYTASALDKTLCVSMSGTASGTATGATIAVGGAINSPDGLTQGPGGFKIWATARVRQIGTTSTTVNGVTTNAYNNTFYFDPNNFNFLNGHTIQVLDDMQAKVEPIAAYGVFDVAPSGDLNRWMTSFATGWGVSTDAFRMLSAVNGNNYNMYKGGGGTGQLDAPRGVSIEGPYAWDIWMHQPVQGGFGIWMGRNPNTQNSSLNNSFFPLFVEGAGGGLGAFTIFTDPNAGRTVISSGTGSGITSTIDMSGTSMTLGASTGTLSMIAQAYVLSGLSGAATRAVTVDATGTIGTTPLPSGFSGKCTAPQTPNFTNGIATGCS